MIDALIAATARVHGMTVVTRNVKDFELAGVQVLNLWVPNIHPCWSGGVLVFAEDAAEPVPSSDVQARDPLGIGDRVG